MSKVALLSFHNNSVIARNDSMVYYFDDLHYDAVQILIFFCISVLLMLVFDFLETYMDQLLELSVFGKHRNYAGHVDFIRVQ